MQHERGLSGAGVGVSVGVGVAVERGGVLDATLGQPQQTDDDQDRATDQQGFVPAALVGQQYGARRQRDHTYGSYGLG